MPPNFIIMRYNLYSVKNKNIVISGASSIIALKTIEKFLEDDAVIYTIVSSEKSVKILKEKFKDRIHIYVCDLCEDKNVRELSEKFQLVSKVDILINFIGIAGDENKDKLNEELFMKIFNTNFFSIVRFIKYFSKYMDAGSSILNIASTLGIRAIPNSIAYSTSKAALIHFSKCLSLEYAPRGIRVNCISPGYFYSDMTKSIVDNQNSYKNLLQKIPMARLLESDEIVPFIRLIVSEAGAYITGANIVMDGGTSCW